MDQPPEPPRLCRRPVRSNPHQTVTRWNNDDYVQLVTAAERAGLTVGAYIRSCVLAAPTTRAQRRPSVELVALATVLKAINKMGGNLHQVAKYRNFGGLPTDAEIHAALIGFDAMVAAHLEAMGRRL